MLLIAPVFFFFSVDFDQILDDDKFQKSIEKIKTIGSTYMAASGINPNESEKDEYAHLCDLVDFAIEMKHKLEDINKHSFNRFELRIGIILVKREVRDRVQFSYLGKWKSATSTLQTFRTLL